MKLSTMQEWLAYIGEVIPKTIVLGLDRVRVVANRLSLLDLLAPVVLVGGTNGKGSTVEALSAIYQAAGYKTGSFTSPFLFKHNEEVQINGIPASDESFCTAFAAIEAARGEIVLTPFEYHTLAALFILKKANPDVYLLEIGMGGRLDAVNVVEPSVSIITSIDLDHTAFLGNTREAIAREKAGILRLGKPVVIAEKAPPASLKQAVLTLGAKAYWVSTDYRIDVGEAGWTFSSSRGGCIENLPKTVLYRENIAAALMAVLCLSEDLPVSEKDIRAGISKACLPGRQEIIPGKVMHWLDVAHNPHALSLLRDRLSANKTRGKTIAVFSMLGDKDLVESLGCVQGVIDEWHVAPLAKSRGASLQQLQAAFDATGITVVNYEKNMNDAYQAARARAAPGDRIVIMGSFATVSALWDAVRT